MTTSYTWFPKKRAVSQKQVLHSTSVVNHPLRVVSSVSLGSRSQKKEPQRKNSGENHVASKGATQQIVDPLRALATSCEIDFIDPLSQLAMDKSASRKSRYTSLDEDHILDNSLAPPSKPPPSLLPNPSAPITLGQPFQPFVSKGQIILQKYTTNERLTLSSSFLTGGSVGSGYLSEIDKVKHRLEQLDYFESASVRHMQDLSQADFVEKINELNEALLNAWNSDQRVLAIRIAIQCAKLLLDTSVLQFYPSKFVLITNILDTFGRLVYTRLWTKANAERAVISAEPLASIDSAFSPADIPPSSKETCQNWFFKVASVRELLPRLYIEASILKAKRFIDVDDPGRSLLRLARMCRGLGDPLVAIYARAYVCRISAEILSEDLLTAKFCFDDFLKLFAQLNYSEKLQEVLAIEKLSYNKYMDLFSPAVQWILSCASGAFSSLCRKDDQLLSTLFDQCAQLNSAFVLEAVVSSLPVSFVSGKALKIVQLIKQVSSQQPDSKPENGRLKQHLSPARAVLLKQLAKCLIEHEPPIDEKLRLLNDAWKIMMRSPSVANYLLCAEGWIEFTAKYMTTFELNTLLGDVIEHVLPDKVYESHYEVLNRILTKLLRHQSDVSALFQMQSFTAFLDLFQKQSEKVACCRSVLESFLKFHTVKSSDVVLSGQVMMLCRRLHESLNALSLDDEKRSMSEFINRSIDLFDFGVDFERQLEFYVDARGNFSELDLVTAFLVHSVNRLALSTRDRVQGAFTRKTAGFVRACIAFNYITVPSVADAFDRIFLYLESAYAALACLCLPQADAILKSLISLLFEAPPTRKIGQKIVSNEPRLLESIYELLSLLLVVPDSPEHGILYLFKGLMNAVDRYPWSENSDGKATVHIKMLAWISVAAQNEYPYSVPGLDSNDRLYGGSAEFLAELQTIGSSLLAQVLSYLKELDSAKAFKRQSSLCVSLLECILRHGNLREKSLQKLAVNLWGLAQKHKQGDHTKIMSVLSYVKQRASRNNALEEDPETNYFRQLEGYFCEENS